MTWQSCLPFSSVVTAKLASADTHHPANLFSPRRRDPVRLRHLYRTGHAPSRTPVKGHAMGTSVLGGAGPVTESPLRHASSTSLAASLPGSLLVNAVTMDATRGPLIAAPLPAWWSAACACLFRAVVMESSGEQSRSCSGGGLRDPAHARLLAEVLV
ncbi:hypothetical protein QYE76_040419 [Lolium multiflorum]|uniref:Uncharacterized protein n=1 Tax=Lolium multiflorum TaxID=4521 RepID=A0AAD8TDB8_LOLMU|nr:hypothetical protein QYE76_040419 [Lolium multiflorum]